MNKWLKSALLTAAFITLLAACGEKQETAPETRADIAAAQTQSAVGVAIAKAEGEHGVEMERCDALTGNERQACKDQADAALTAAKDAARGTADPSKIQ